MVLVALVVLVVMVVMRVEVIIKQYVTRTSVAEKVLKIFDGGLT